MDDVDSVPVGGGSGSQLFNLKLVGILFLLFIFVVSDFFTSSVISGFGEKAVRCRSPTSWGVVLQGIFLVILYVIAVYLIENGII